MWSQTHYMCTQARCLLLGIFISHQQAVSGVYSNTSGEGMMDGQGIHIGGVTVAPALIHISTPMKVHRVSALLLLLTHVFQLHLRQLYR